MKNTAASIRARLTNLARSTGVTLPSLIERFAIGRLLWRLDQAGLTDRFVLKGAQLFSLWADTPHRPTRDLDLLSYGDPSEEGIKKLFEELIATPAEPSDGLQWSGVDVSRTFTSEFAQDPTKNTQWNAFLRKSHLEAPSFPEVLASISPFLLPLLNPETGKEASSAWSPERSWISPSEPW